MEADAWTIEPGKGVGLLELGASKDDILKRLTDAGMEFELDDEEPQWLFVVEPEISATFGDEHPPRLHEISIESDAAVLGPDAPVGGRLHQVIELLKVSDADTVWQFDRDDQLDRDDQRDTFPMHRDGLGPSDEELLDRGTLWVHPLGLGLQMSLGTISIVRLRQPQAAPRRGVGTLTPEQRALSARSDLFSLLLRPAQSPGQRWFGRLAAMALVAAMALLVWQAVQYQQRWNNAAVVEGEVIDLKPGPPDPFPSEFTIAYTDLDGTARQVVFQRADVFVLSNIGEKVEVRYLPEAPDKPLGPARVNDIAFVRFFPLGVGIVGAYAALQVAGMVYRRLRQPA